MIYNDGKACAIQAEPAGSADSETTCATKATVELVVGALMLTTGVLDCSTGKWRNASFVTHRESYSKSGYIEGGQHVNDGCTSWTVEQTGECLDRYVLMSPSELEGAVSVTVDGVLMYASEDGRLVSVLGGGAGTSEGPQMEKLRHGGGNGQGNAVQKTAGGLAEGKFGKVSSKNAGMSK